MTCANDLVGAIAGELYDLAFGLTALQDVLSLPAPPGAATGGPAVEAVIALQDIDRLTQTAAALAAMLRHLADNGDAHRAMTRAAAFDVLRAGGLPSLQARIQGRLAGAADGTLDAAAATVQRR